MLCLFSTKTAWPVSSGRAKWRTLKEIQARVEQLHTADNLAEKDMMDAINRLMDYHDRIKAPKFRIRSAGDAEPDQFIAVALVLANIDKLAVRDTGVYIHGNSLLR